jgi:hypothetical protein
MDIVETLKADYAKFPEDQTYSLYAKEVYFKDPLNEFRGVKRYQLMIGTIKTIFQDVKMDLHQIHREGETIKMEWTLNLTSPLPWKPRLAIPGYSELEVNPEGLIDSHVDYWHISRWNVLKQNFLSSRQKKRNNDK